jgi:hypothetical protein
MVVVWKDRIHTVVSAEELGKVSDPNWRTAGFSGLFLGTQGSIYEFTRIRLQHL